VPASRPLTPRKTPTQARAQATYDRIVQAGTRVLVQHGYAGASTNRIAAEAGVSPGSLYQYFPNKDAIVVAVVERFADHFAAHVAGELTALLDARPDELVRSILEVLVDALAEQPEILRAVTEDIPREASLGRIAAFEQRVGDIIRGYLMLHRDLLRDADIEAAIWILVQVIEQLTVRYVLDAPAIPRERFVDELAHLATSYLAAPPRRGRD
jgi:AcrR family transcriptional regulator